MTGHLFKMKHHGQIAVKYSTFAALEHQLTLRYNYKISLLERAPSVLYFSQELLICHSSLEPEFIL
jgi:hypothetical protein